MPDIPESRGSLEGGLIGGAVSGVVVGIGYYFEYPAGGLYRVPLIFAYSMVVGFTAGANAQLGVPWIRQFSLGNSAILENGWLLATFLCAVTGVPVGTLGAGFFVRLGGPLDPILLVFGFMVGTVFVALGSIFRVYGRTLRIACQAVGFAVPISGAHCILAGAVVLPFGTSVTRMFVGPTAHPLTGGSLVGGAVGALMGSQIWLTLLLFRRWQPADGGIPQLKRLPSPMGNIGEVKQSQPDSEDRSVLGYDVFVCHASEDKASFVDPLVQALQEAGIGVWYDKVVFDWGEDLRNFIDSGLQNCRLGVVVFSKAFLGKKRWTEYELNGLLARETATKKKLILPIWHGVNREDFLKYSPTFADRLARDSQKDSIEEIVGDLKHKLNFLHEDAQLFASDTNETKIPDSGSRKN